MSAHRNFSETERCLILATGFYEYTTSEKAKVKLKDQHFFTMRGEEWFWIGIVKYGAFAMLTTGPGPDMEPYHDRQICVLPPAEGMHWLMLDKPHEAILKAPPEGTLEVQTLRRDGLEAGYFHGQLSRLCSRGAPKQTAPKLLLRYQRGHSLLIAPSLEDMGMVLFGPDSRELLANVLGVTFEAVTGWDDDPTSIPDHIAGELRKIGIIRMQEIEVMLAQILRTGLARWAPDREESGL